MKTLWFALPGIGFPMLAQADSNNDGVLTMEAAKAFTAAMKKAGNRCGLVGYEGVGHSFFNQAKYGKLTIAEADKFLTGLGWLDKKVEHAAATGDPTNRQTNPGP